MPGETAGMVELVAQPPGVAIDIDLDSFAGLTLVRDPSVASEMLTDLWSNGDFGTVARLIPPRFPARARLDEPNRRRDGDGFDPTLAGVLARHTTSPDDVFFCLWEGYGSIGPVPSGVQTIQRPGRGYLLFRGPVMSWGAMMPLPMGALPDLVWPADGAWFVGSDTDIDWDFIGASDDCLSDLERERVLHVARVAPEDRLVPPDWRP